jgi:hypothetical protein
LWWRCCYFLVSFKSVRIWGFARDLFCRLLFGKFPPFNLHSEGFDVLLISVSVLVGWIVIVWLETVLLLLLLVQ